MSSSLDKLRAAMETASPSEGAKNPTMTVQCGNPNWIKLVMVTQ